MRKKIAAGNWKMNADKIQALELFLQITEHYDQLGLNDQLETIIAPPYLYADLLSDKAIDYPHLHIAAQNCHHQEKGAFTGEISAAMLSSVGVTHVICGHSERRQYFAESNEIIRQKVEAILSNGMRPIFCCGEPEEVREAGNHLEFVQQQMIESLFHLSSEQIEKVVIAYEPIWAIGTGKTAVVAQIEEMHTAIRSLLTQHYGAKTAENISILYGGSCNAANAAEIFSCKNVDGGLIGGASLKAADFIHIIKTLGQCQNS